MAESRTVLKDLVDKRDNKILCIESGSDFADTLFSFLSIPIGTIIRLARNHSVPVGLGCNNLYASVESCDVQHFRTEACRDMLLCPHSRAGATLKNLKFNVEDCETTRYFRCPNESCQSSQTKLISYYTSVVCRCGYLIDKEINLSVKVADEVFVKRLSTLIVTDDLQVIAQGTPAVSAFIEKLMSTASNTAEEVNLSIGVDEVLNLLMRSFESKTPLSDILLKHPLGTVKTGNLPIYTHSYSQMLGDVSDGAKMSVNLIVSKSKKVVCYAETGKDFVDFLFSFLIIPLGFILKQIHFGSLKGCIDHLYRSVQNLDDQFLKSHYCNELLLSPKLPPQFCYENHPLGIGMATFRFESAEIVDPKSHSTDKVCDQGFLKGPAMFMVNDSLVVTSISPVLGLSILNELNVPITDIKVKSVNVGKEEAFGLLVASFASDHSALTSVFLDKVMHEQ